MLLEKQLQYNKVYKIPLTINQCTLLLGLFFPQLLISTLTVRFDRNYFILATRRRQTSMSTGSRCSAAHEMGLRD